MKSQNIYQIFRLLPLVVLLAACNSKEAVKVTYYGDDYSIMSKTLNLPDKPIEYNITLPKHYGSRVPSPVNSDMATLGRVLFYDTKLSKDGTISCASCHKQELAFSDDAALSKGVSNRQTKRNSLALGSVVSFATYYGYVTNTTGQVPFFWDNRAANAPEQSKQTIGNPLEMDMHMNEIVEAVKNADYYRPLFRIAFGTEDVTEERVLNSIGQFVGSLATYESKFDVEADKIASGDIFSFTNYDKTFSGFSTSENLGKSLYMANCSGCHSPNFSAPSRIEANNGLDEVYVDKGIGALKGSFYNGVFKVPTLRNIELSAPYMHDGRFKTLRDVINHYSEGLKSTADYTLTKKSKSGFQFTETEKTALEDFLKTLTDHKYVKLEKYSNPFKS